MKDEDIDQEVLSYLGKLPNFTSLPWRISEYGTSTQRKSDGRDYIMTIKLMDYGANAHPDARFRCAAESDFGKETSGNTVRNPETAIALLLLHQKELE